MVALLVVLLAGCRVPMAAEVEDPLAVGTGPDPEVRLVAEIVAELARRSELPARVVALADAGDARRALEVGDVDVLPSYTGEAWLRVLGRGDPPGEPGTSLARVREFDEARGLVWLPPRVAQDEALTSPPADATFAFVVQVEADDVPTPAADLVLMSQLATLISDLDGSGGDPVLCVDPTFLAREDGLGAVLDAYQISREAVTVVDATPPEAVLGVAAGGCLAGLTSATDGAAWLAGQRPLVDDLGVFPAFVVAPVVREDALARHPGLEEALAPLLEGLTTARLGTWNARVVAGEDPAVVAAAAADELTAA